MATQHYITPDAPANPYTNGKQEVPIAPVSAWAAGCVSSVLAFPTALDQARLERAFARAASFWPSVVGRYVKSSQPGPEFAISLTNLPIPFSTRTIEAGYPYKNKNVIQEELGPYLPAMAEKYYVAGEDAALLVVRLTTLAPSGASVLGVNWAHVLGDGAALHRFLTDVSIFYNQPTAELEAGEDMPTLEPHVRLPPYTEEIGREYALDILTPRPLEEVGKGYADAVIQSQVFHIVLTCDEVAHIMATRVPGEKLSENDMFTGWWISLLERAGQHVDYVVQTINYRSFHQGHPAFPRSLPTLAANVAQMRKIPLPARSGTATPGRRAVEIARAVRHELTHLRADADHTLRWLSNAAHEVGTAAHNGESALLVPAPGGVVVNSNLRYDWAIKFGQPSANFHTDVSLLRFLRVFQANPREGASAKGERDTELVFRVEWGPAAEAVTRLIEEDRARWASEPLAASAQDDAPEPEVKTFSFGQTVHNAPWGGYGN